MIQTNVALIGDFNGQVKAHHAIPQAFELVSRETGASIGYRWVGTEELEQNLRAVLQEFHSVWCVPGSPYASFLGALNGIRYARENFLPFLGTCGGFQHALIEYARDVVGISDADHAESATDTSNLLITPLVCSLKGARGSVHYIPDTKLYKTLGVDQTEEQFVCNFGFNRAYKHIFSNDDLMAAAIDEQGDLRAFELRSHPFFVGTLFQPELKALEGELHPIISAFFRASLAQ